MEFSTLAVVLVLLSQAMSIHSIDERDIPASITDMKDLIKMIKEEILEEMKVEMKVEMKEEMKEEMKDEMKEEMKKEMKDEIQHMLGDWKDDMVRRLSALTKWVGNVAYRTDTAIKRASIANERAMKKEMKDDMKDMLKDWKDDMNQRLSRLEHCG